MNPSRELEVCFEGDPVLSALELLPRFQRRVLRGGREPVLRTRLEEAQRRRVLMMTISYCLFSPSFLSLPFSRIFAVVALVCVYVCV